MSMNADSQVSLDCAVTIALMQRAMIKKERQWMSDFFQTGVWNISDGLMFQTTGTTGSARQS